MMRLVQDGHVYEDWLSGSEGTRRQNGLVVSTGELESEIDYIIANNIEHVHITLLDPKFFIYGAEYALAHRQEGNSLRLEADLSMLRKCRQIRSLALEGNILHAEVLDDLPELESLAIDNTMGKSRMQLQNLKLHTLYIQKPGRNIEGFDRIEGLRELAVWNYQPKSRNLWELSGLNALEKLMLIRPRIDSLEGLERLSRLTVLEIHYSRTLKDISALRRRPDLKDVKMSHVPNVEGENKLL